MAMKRRWTDEELAAKREAMAKEPGAFVVKSLSRESRGLITRMNEYDWLANSLYRLLRNSKNDRGKILELIDKCVSFEADFQNLVSEMRTFISMYVPVKQYNGNRQIQDKGSGGSTGGKAAVEE